MNRTVNTYILTRAILLIEEAEIEAVAIEADADGIPNQLALLEIVARAGIETPRTGEIPPRAAPDLMFMVRATGIRVGIEIRIEN